MLVCARACPVDPVADGVLLFLVEFQGVNHRNYETPRRVRGNCGNLRMPGRLCNKVVEDGVELGVAHVTRQEAEEA